MDISELVQSIKLSDYIGQYCNLELRGDEYWCCSPFTNEDTPSFSIRDSEHVYYDFSSGHGGNIFTFIQKYHKVCFRDALNIAAKYIGVSVGDITLKNHRPCDVFKKFKKPYLNKQRNYKILDRHVMAMYEFNKSKLSCWEEEGISFDIMNEFGVKYDPFTNRIVFPIFDADGNIINVSGRTLDEGWKEKGIRKYTYLYKLGILDIIYGLDKSMKFINDSQQIIIFEGAKSVMKAYSFGIKNVGAILTSHLNEYQYKILLNLGVEVIFALDKGVDVTEDKYIKRLSMFLPVYTVNDIDGLICEKDSPVDKGGDVFRKLLNGKRKVIV